MPKILITPIADFETPQGPSDQFAAINNDWDAQSWRGRGSTFELPIGGAHGAGGTRDDGPSPASKSFKIAGPKDVTGKGSTPVGGRK